MTRARSLLSPSKLRSWVVAPALFAAFSASAAAVAQDAGPAPPAPGTPAAAPDAPPASDAPPALDELAQKHFDDGRAAAARDDWRAAYTSYRAALAVQDHHVVLGALGDAAHRLGKHRDAAEYLTLYLQKAPAADASARAAAQAALADARTRVGMLTITAPDGAEIFVDRVIIGKAPLGREVFVEPGESEVEARSGDEVGRRIVTVDRGAAAAVTLRFGDVPAPTASAVATSAPPAPTTAPSAAPPSSLRRDLVIAGASIGARLSLFGASLLGLSAVKWSDESTLRRELVGLGRGNVCAPPARDPRCDQVRDAGTAADGLTSAGVWLLVGGVATGAATLVYYLVTREPAGASPQTAIVAPYLDVGPAESADARAAASPRGGGATLSLTW